MIETHHHDAETLLVTLPRTLPFQSLVDFSRLCQEALTKNTRFLVFDLKATESLDNEALAVLCGLSTKMVDKGGRAVFASPSPGVLRVIETFGPAQAVRRYPSPEVALERIKKKVSSKKVDMA
jgi:anti-anti-sigma regulatory factor